MSKLNAVLAAVVAALIVVLAVTIVVVTRDSSDKNPAAGEPSATAPATGPAGETAAAPESAAAPAPPASAAEESSRTPKDATEITGTGTGSDLQQVRRMIQSPSGAISCSIWEYRPEEMQCLVERNGSSTVVTGVDFADGSLTTRQVNLGDPASRPTAPGTPQIVTYGQTVYYGPFYCASAQDGMTCWNSVTGAGAFMSRERVQKITR